MLNSGCCSRMLLVLSEEHKEHLSFLPQVDAAALEFLRRGTSPKIYEGAARKLGVSVEMVQHGVEGLMFLMTESSKHMISEVDFLDSVLVLGFSEELNQILLQLYLQHHAHIRSILSQLPSNQPAYHNLDRAVRQQVVPMLTLRLLLSGVGDGVCALGGRFSRRTPAPSCTSSHTGGRSGCHEISHARRIFRNIK
ncbi:hypothetical protein F7725_028184 [Dissostichus mawsoni]|uniref:COMM domain containing 2 n=1 Tax=Dissostichus mawsoni TaxID=36200 RepID=A0A7J5XEZ2_DISMA|nr:hypothetical protein F7725_028184 [Dissostichus mawsoni]